MDDAADNSSERASCAPVPTELMDIFLACDEAPGDTAENIKQFREEYGNASAPA